MTTCFMGGDPLQSPFFLPGTNTPGNGVLLFTYVAGSVSTKVTVYKDPNGATPWTNPIVLDSGGRLPLSGELWIPAGTSIKAVYAPSNDSDPPSSPYLTYDNLSGINDTTVSVSEWQAGPAPIFVSGTSFTLAGDQTATFTRGRRIRTTNTAGTVYSTIVNSVFGALTTITVVNDSPGVLDSGLSAVFYGLLSSNNGSIPGVTLSSSGAFTFQQPISLAVSSSSFKQTFYPTSSAANVSTIVPAANITLNVVGTAIHGLAASSSANTQLSVTARDYAFRNAAGVIKPVYNTSSYIVDTSVNGINGRDQAGAFPSSSVVHLYAAFNETSLGAVLSTAGPTLFAGPSIAGYTYWVYAGSHKLNGQNFGPIQQYGDSVSYTTPITITSIATIASTWAQIASSAVLSAIPDIATRMDLSISGTFQNGAAAVGVDWLIGIGNGTTQARMSDVTPQNFGGRAGMTVQLPNLNGSLWQAFADGGGIAAITGGPSLSVLCTGYKVPL